MQFFTLFAAIVIDIDASSILMGVIFIVAYHLLNFLVIQPYLTVREAREEGTSGSMEDAAELDDKALRAREHYEQEVANIRREASDVRESLRTQGAEEQAEMIEDVRVELAAKLEKERLALQQQLETATNALGAKADSLAASIVSKVLPGA